MRIETSAYSNWSNHEEVDDHRDARAPKAKTAAGSGHTRGIRAAASGDPAAKADNDASRTLATELVASSELVSGFESFSAACDAVESDIAQGKDTTDNAEKLASALCDIRALLSADKPSPAMQANIDRLAIELKQAGKDDSAESIGKRAGVDLSPLGRQPDLSRYATYGKSASSYARNVIFGLSRFGNSKVLADKGWLKDWRGGSQKLMNWIGDKPRLGGLLATRANSAGSGFAKGTVSVFAGLNKLANGEDPTKDFVSAGAAIGQGINEVVVGAGTDWGNYLAKQRQARVDAEKARSAKETASASKAEPATEFGDFDPDNHLLSDQIDAENGKAATAIDAKVGEQQKKVRDGITQRLERTHPDVQQLVLQEAANDAAPEYIALRRLGDTAKQSIADAATDAHENIKAIDYKAEMIRGELAAQGFDTVAKARASGNAAALDRCARLDEYAGLKSEAYTQFNGVVEAWDAALGKSTQAFGELGQLLKATPASERPGKLNEWADKYGKQFAEVQAKFLSGTDSWPEWMKISKPLRMQMIPSLINAVLGAVPFGFQLDDYLKKQREGKLTPQDRLSLGGSALNLAAGMATFVPGLGPFLSVALATAGILCSSAADQYQARQFETDAYNLKEKAREDYNAKHPEQQIAEPYDGD